MLSRSLESLRDIARTTLPQEGHAIEFNHYLGPDMLTLPLLIDPEILEGIRKEQRAAAEKDGEHGRREEPKGDNLGLSVGRQGVLV